MSRECREDLELSAIVRMQVNTRAVRLVLAVLVSVQDLRLRSRAGLTAGVEHPGVQK